MRMRVSGRPCPPRDRLLGRPAKQVGGAQSVRSSMKPRPPRAPLRLGRGSRRVWGGAWREGSRTRPRPPCCVGAGSRVGSTRASLAACHGRAAGAAGPGGKSGHPAGAPDPLAPGSRHLLHSAALGLGLVPAGVGSPAAAHSPPGLPQPPGKPPNTHSDPEPQVTRAPCQGRPQGQLCSDLPEMGHVGVPEFSDP